LEEINTFLNITGPWGVVGILLAFAYFWLKRDDKSVRETMDAQVKALELLSKTLDKLEERLQEHDERARDIYAKQERSCELLNTVLSCVQGRGASLIVNDAGRG